MTTRKRKAKEPVSVVPKAEPPLLEQMRNWHKRVHGIAPWAWEEDTYLVGINKLQFDYLRTLTEPPNSLPTTEEMQARLRILEPSAADLDADAAEKKSRFDTTPAPERDLETGQLSGHFYPLMRGDYPPFGPSVLSIGPKFTATAVISASVAVLAILGTLWAMYYIIRPKLDIHVTVQQATARFSPAPTTSTESVPALPNQLYGHDDHGVFLGGKQNDPVPAKPTAPSYKPAPDSRDLSITANEDVWLKITAKGRDSNVEHTLFQGSVQKGWEGRYAVLPFIILDVRAGKEKALDFKTAGGGIAPVNQYMGSGKLAEYVFDGKDLLAQK